MKLILLDSNSMINRAFHALPPLTNKDGLFTNAVLGYTSMLQKLIAEENPTHIGAVFDCRAKTFRHNMYDGYKATRKPMAEELAMQIPELKKLLSSMGIRVLAQEGIEADDIIGTLAKRFDLETIIVSGDKDCLQLADSTTTVYLTKRGVSDVVKFTPAHLMEAEGFTPAQIIEYKGLAGDTSDNIPGAMGVGDKTARALLLEYGDIDTIYKNLAQIKGKLQERLAASRENVYLSRKLATIEINADVECALSDLTFSYPLPVAARENMQRLEFKNLIGRFQYHSDGDAPSAAVSIRESEIIAISDVKELRNAIKEIREGTTVAIDIGEQISVSYENTTLSVEFKYDLFGGSLTEAEAVQEISVLLSKKHKKVFFDVKQSMYFFENYGVQVMEPYEDLLLKSYLIFSNKTVKDEKQLLTDYGFPAKNISAELLQLNDVLDEKLIEKELTGLYRELELPLIHCLYQMEKEGFRLDVDVLNELDSIYTKEISDVLTEIYELAGEEFNVNSNRQLGEILFGKLGLPHAKKNKTGYSVSAEVLEELEHPIIARLLKYRQMTKLKSTYIDGWRNVMKKSTHKVHTLFKQSLTATGRLSSNEPNLQNIPIRRKEGRELRRVFIPSENCRLLSADYSQIELRLLAHFSKDENLLYAFKNDIDVHTLTASKIFRTPLALVDSEMRSSAKAVNFGIIYGISSFGLAKNTGVGNYRAKEFIAEYFDNYPAVRDYMDRNIKEAKKSGYLRSLMGRIRSFPELTSSQYNVRSFGERAAMNFPLQASASDIIKVAMLRVCDALQAGGFRAKLILQVHDELILDVPEEEVEDVSILIKNVMEKAVTLEIPLTVNVASGKNWYEVK